MNHVISATAVRLKDAGFPQPVPEFGQIWYDNEPGPHVLVHHAGRVWEMATNRYAGTVGVDSEGGMVFAPTATDILRELDENHFLTTLLDGRFCVALFVGSGDSIHNNPAEACAAAWLALNEKKQEQP